MTASNVHGKNQHIEGCFVNHISSLKLIINDKVLKVQNLKVKDFFFIVMVFLMESILEIEKKLLKLKVIKLPKKIFFNIRLV